MVDIVILIATTPVPTILAIGGLLLLLLGIADGPVAGISIQNERKRLAVTIGSLLLLIGLIFYGLPLFLSAGVTAQTDSSATEAIVENTDSQTELVDQNSASDTQTLLEEARDWPLIYQDNFETDRGVWQVGEIQGDNFTGNLNIQDGQYIWSMVMHEEGSENTFGAYVSVADVDLAN